MTNTKKNKLAVTVLSLIFALAFVLVGCAPEAVPEPTSEAIEAEEVAAEAVEESMSEVRILNVPAGVEIPAFYTEIVINGIEDQVFAFNDEKGNTQLRVYGEHDHLENGEAVHSHAGFFAIGLEEDGEEPTTGIWVIGEEVAEDSDSMLAPVYELVMANSEDIEFVEDTADMAGTAVVKIYETETPDDGSGTEVTDNLSEDTDVVVPEGYNFVNDNEGLYSYTTINNEMVYRVYAEIGDQIGYFMSDAEGVIAAGALMIDVEEEAALMTAYNEAVAAEEDTPANTTYVVLNIDGIVLTGALVDAEVGMAIVEETVEEETAGSENTTNTDSGSGSDNNTGGSSGNSGGNSSDSGSGDGGSSGGSGGNSGGGTSNPPPESVAPTPPPPVVETPAPVEYITVIICNTCGHTMYSNSEIDPHMVSHLAANEGFSYRTETRPK